MQQHQYLVNKTDTILTFKNGYVKIDPHGFKKVTPKEAEHEEYILAIDRGLAELTSDEPEAIVKPPVDLSLLDKVDPRSGMTQEEYAAYKAAQKEPAELKGITTTQLGQSDKVVTADEDEKEVVVTDPGPHKIRAKKS